MKESNNMLRNCKIFDFLQVQPYEIDIILTFYTTNAQKKRSDNSDLFICCLDSVYYIYRISADKAFNIASEDAHKSASCLKTCPGNMRSNDAVVACEERIILFSGLS